MSEPFIKLNMWMADTGLNPSEIIILAVIHSFTEAGGSYFGGNAGLMKWTGCSKRAVIYAVDHLVRDGWVIVDRPAKGQTPASLKSNGAKIAPLRGAEIAQEGCKNCTARGAEIAPNKIIDKIDINNTPYNPPKRGKAQAAHKHRGTRRNPALNYSQGGSYTKDELKKLGVSFGEEFYSDE